MTAALALDQTSRINTIMGVLKDDKITVVQPTTIQLPLTFLEGQTTFTQPTDVGNAKSLIGQFVKDFVQPSTRVIMWQGNNTVNLGTIVVVNNVPELHYISIGVG